MLVLGCYPKSSRGPVVPSYLFCPDEYGSCECRDAKKRFSRPRFVGSRRTGLPSLVIHTCCSPGRVKYGSRALSRSAIQSRANDFFIVLHFCAGNSRDMRQIAEAQIEEGVADMVEFEAQVNGREAT